MKSESRAWMQALQAQLWAPAQGVRTGTGLRRETYTYQKEARRLDPEEWGLLKDILKTERPLVELCTTEFGFGCGMSVFGEGGEVLLQVDKNHLPLEGRKVKVNVLHGLPKKVPATTTTFEDGWDAFSPFTHHPDNAARLVAAGRPEPKQKGYYEY